MSQDVQVVPVTVRRDAVAQGKAMVSRAAAAATPPGLMATVHRLLRGRYLLAIPLAVILGVTGLVLGWRSQEVGYRSAGMIQIKPVLPRVMYTNEQNSVMPMFDAYIDSQLMLMSSRRVVDLAMQQSEYRALGRGVDPQAVAEFQKSLKVVRFKGSDMIQVSFLDRDPNAAMEMVRLVIAAYEKVYNENNAKNGANRFQILEDRRTMLGNELKSINDRILAIAQEFGSDSLVPIYQFKFEELNKVESELKQAQLARASAEAMQGKPTTRPGGEEGAVAAAAAVRPTTQPAIPEERLPELIALVDPQMAQYLAQRLAQLGEIHRMEVRLGTNNPRVADAHLIVDQLEAQIKDRVEFFKRAEAAGLVSLPTRNVKGPDLAALPENLDKLRERERRIEGLYEAAKQELVSIGRKRLQIEQLRTDAAGVRAKLEEFKARIEQLNLEGSVGGRLEIIATGDRPVVPDNDQRQKIAIAGGMGGLASGLGLFMLLGLIDRRVRFAEDAHLLNNNVSLLGVLPELPKELGDPSQALIAGHCVHHIRALLQIQRDPDRDKVLAVTSPAPGSGKTSLTTALGLSFAACGSRTLLIDCDLVGAGLTTRMNAIIRRPIGQILRREGLLSEEQLERGLTVGRSSSRKLGEALTELGYVSEEAVSQALSAQAHSTVGLLDVLAGDPLSECIASTAIPGLFILPLGAAGAHHVPQLSPVALGRILDEARRDYDTIIVDTGPVLGSTEATFVTAEADKVILILSRGEQRSQARRAIQSLDSAGTDLIGVVFNRAVNHDVLTSNYSSGASISSIPSRAAAGASAARHARLGPIASAAQHAIDVPERPSTGA